MSQTKHYLWHGSLGRWPVGAFAVPGGGARTAQTAISPAWAQARGMRPSAAGLFTVAHSSASLTSGPARETGAPEGRVPATTMMSA